MTGFIRRLSHVFAIAAALLLAFSFSPARAQLAPIDPSREPDEAAQKEKVKATAEFTRPDADGKSVLSITAKMAKGWHIYSVTQAKGGPVATQIRLKESREFKAPEQFKPTKAPEVHEYPKAWKGLKVEEHHETVTWKGEIELAPSVDPAKLEIQGAVYAQACADQCIAPKSYRFVARLAEKGANDKVSAADRRDNVWPAKRASGTDIRLVANQQLLDELPTLPLDGGSELIGKSARGGDATEGRYRNPNIEATITGRIEPAVVAPGGTAKLILSITPNSGWFIYAYADQPMQGTSKPTLIHLSETDGLIAGMPVTSSAAKRKKSPLDGQLVSYHDRQVEWTIPLNVPEGSASGPRSIKGLVGLLTCSDTACLIPHGVEFAGTLTVSEQEARGPTALALKTASYAAVANARLGVAPPGPIAGAGRDAGAEGMEGDAFAALPSFEPQNLSAPAGLPAILLLALLGGLLLNLMPCVLPVIGLKILAFVEQGGRQRSHVLALNLWYSAGILSVFLVLATLAAFLNVGWGEQFQSTGFNVAMAAVVFVMALSFLGVWEIPIPGFAGSSTATKLAHREGFFGAFSKGVLTTVLATPCSGPFLGTVFGFTLRQPPLVIYLIFAAIGVGMALPYLLIGAFPKLIRFLPKPGAWMDTFKQVMGFVLLGTVVFLFTFMDRDYVVPTFALLAVLWAACWWINRTPLTADVGRRLLAWGQAAVFAVIVGYFSFTLLLPRPSVLPWEPFSIAAWNKHTAQGKTVLVDFTADWCVNCKVNMKWAIDTDAVKRLTEQNDVVPLLADYSDMSEEIKSMLEALGSRSIPVLAVFPAGEPTRPIVLRDLVTKGQVVEALRQAGPSKASDTEAVAMRRP
ncbi:MAG: cytochrome c biogenesis protein CcdA [Pirellulales bacterium]